MALNLAPFGRWTLRDKAAQRRLALRYVSSKVSPAQSRVRGNELGLVTQAAVQLHGLR